MKFRCRNLFYGLSIGLFFLGLLFFVGDEVYAASEAEDNNNSMENATAIDSNKTYKGYLSEPTDIDWYCFVLDKPGIVSFKHTNASARSLSSSPWIVELMTEDENIILSGRNFYNNTDPLVSDKCGLNAGKYYVKIYTYNYSFCSDLADCEYGIILNYTQSDECETEVNDTARNATIISSNKTLTGTMYKTDDRDYYTFSLDETSNVKIQFSNDNPLKSNNSRWWVDLINSEGERVYSKKVYSENVITVESDSFTLQPGKHFILVSGENGGEVGLPYYLTLISDSIADSSQSAEIDESSNNNVDTSKSPVEAFVTRIYEVGLSREPEAEGLADWTNRLQTGEAAAVNVVQGVLCSDEYKNKGKSNGEIVNDCYQAMLGRAADEGGYNDWVTKLDSGMSVNAIFAGFVGSEEFGNLCASYGINPGTYELTEARDMNPGTTQFVSRLYTQALGRSFDADGLNDWCGQINANPSRDNILNISTNGFLNSQEFQNKGLDNTEYVKVLYRTYLGREYDDAGLSDWVGQLDRGEKDRNAVAAGFAYSAEFNEIMAGYGL